jgi:hypothetical protein
LRPYNCGGTPPRFESAAELDRVRAVIVPAGEENFDRLRDHLATS